MMATAAASDLPVTVNHNTVSVRDEMVQTAIKFLENPNVVNTPLAQKQKFLQRKGLTDQEIQIACEKAGSYTQHEQQRLRPSLPPVSNVVTYNPYGPVKFSFFDKFREIVHNIAIFSIVAYVIHKFYEKFIAPFLFGKKKKGVEESIEEMDKNMKTSVEELRSSLNSVKIEVDKISQGAESSSTRQLMELKSEIASVKGLLLGRKQFPAVANSPVVPPSIPAWQMSSVTPDSNDHADGNPEEATSDMEIESGSGSSEHEHRMKTSESSLEIIYTSRDCDLESCHSRKSNKEDNDKD